jgi:hypothetical protein
MVCGERKGLNKIFDVSGQKNKRRLIPLLIPT